MRSLLFGFPPLKNFIPLALLLCSVLLCPVCAAAAQGAVVINEIYYDHPGKDDGYEFIELINTDPSGRCIETLRLEFHNGAGSGWELLWQGSAGDTIPAGGLFVVGGEFVIPAPDAFLRMGLQNGPDAVRLVGGGVVLDLVAYGGLEDPEYVEGVSAGSAASGSSLCRVPDGRDSDDNRHDFQAMIPSPGGLNVPQNDVLLSLVDGTRRMSRVDPGIVEDIRFLLVNNGTAAIPAGAVSVELRDSALAGVSVLGEGENAERIDAGSSYETAFSAGFEEGYHFLTLRADYAADERPDNNRIALIRRAGYPHVLISEIMSCPADPCPQYIELFNAGASPCDLNAHVIRDRSQSFSPLTSTESILEPGAYLVVTAEKAELMSAFPQLPADQIIEMEGSWPHLNHSGSGGIADSVILGDPYGIPLEAVAYPPQSSAQCAKSLERVDLFASTGAPVWVLSPNPRGGSPGSRNEASIVTSPREKMLSVSPNPFSPESGEKLLIVVNPPRTVERTCVTVFDTRGRVVKIVGSSRVHPYVFVWEGRRDDGTTVPSGLYVLACEMAASGGKRLGVEKVVVGCGRKRR